MKKLRILACTFICCPPGKPGFTGGEDVLGWNLLRQVARFHDVWALTREEARPVIEETLAEEPIHNLRFLYVGLPRWLRPLLKIQGGHQFYYHLWQVKAYFTARKLHKEIDFQLFHHITYANDWGASFIGAQLPVPYVRGPGGGAHRTPRGLGQEYTLGGRLWERVRTLGQWIFRHDPYFLKGQSRAGAILVCNREAEDNIPSRWSHKVHLFPVNGISTNDLALTKQTQTSANQFRVLSAGSLIRVKGFSLAIKAFKEFADKHSDAKYTIIGSGPEEHRLRKLVQRSKLDGRVHFLGAMGRNQLLGDMAACDVFLFPSLRDGGGAVVVEAMSAGKPVVCLDTGGPGMHISEEYGVKIAPISSCQAIHELADALERLYLDEELRLKLGAAARQKAERDYHWDRLGERLMEIYAQVIPTKSSH